MNDGNPIYYIGHIILFIMIHFLFASLRKNTSSTAVNTILLIVMNIGFIFVAMFEYLMQTRIFTNIFSIIIINLLPNIIRLNFTILFWGAAGAFLLRNANVISKKLIPQAKDQTKYSGEAPRPTPPASTPSDAPPNLMLRKLDEPDEEKPAPPNEPGATKYSGKFPKPSAKKEA